MPQMTDIVLFQMQFSHLPTNRQESLHENPAKELLSVGCAYLDMCDEHGCGYVMLLGSAHKCSIDLLSVDSLFTMQRAVEEEQLKLSFQLPLALLPLHLSALFTDVDQAPSGTV